MRQSGVQGQTLKVAGPHELTSFASQVATKRRRSP